MSTTTTFEIRQRRSLQFIVAWAVQEKEFIVLNTILEEARGTRALKFMSKFMFVKTAKVDS